METVILDAVVAEDGSLRPVRTNSGLCVGEEVVVTVQRKLRLEDVPYPGKGTVLKYIDPDEPVGLEDWELLP